MAVLKFDIIEYLSGLTSFVFDKAILNRVAFECGVCNVETYTDLIEEDRDRCKAALLETIVFGPHQTASSTSKHGSYALTVGAQTITSQALESIKSELRRIYIKYSNKDKLETLNASDGEIRWISETD